MSYLRLGGKCSSINAHIRDLRRSQLGPCRNGGVVECTDSPHEASVHQSTGWLRGTDSPHEAVPPAIDNHKGTDLLHEAVPLATDSHKGTDSPHEAVLTCVRISVRYTDRRLRQYTEWVD